MVSTAELARRPSRLPDYVAENRALVALAQEMATAPDGILQKLADTALTLCRAHSAGFSLLEDGDQKRAFHWRAIAGQWRPHVGGGTPRDFGPCGTVLDRNAAMLCQRPERDYPYLGEVSPLLDEGLLLPFYVNGDAVGTIWVISHDESRRFDAEDLRVMTSLATFAASAYQTLLSLDAAKKANEQQKLLMSMLDHRVKNMLARVAVVTKATSQDSSSVDEFARALDGRIQSMMAAHSLLTQNRWYSVNLPALVRTQLAPFATDTNMRISGPDVMLSSEATQALAEVFHELVTNAAKYGALSKPDGRVLVSWDDQPNEKEVASVMIVWQELGGPPTAAPVRSGYGTRLIRELIPHELGGTIDFTLAPDGACCKIGIPLERGNPDRSSTGPPYRQSLAAGSREVPPH
jgi:two-component sensor histidine kinase